MTDPTALLLQVYDGFFHLVILYGSTRIHGSTPRSRCNGITLQPPYFCNFSQELFLDILSLYVEEQARHGDNAKLPLGIETCL
jgi:hypothetical protein